ncbi:hypothetical protein [Planctomycetes bacterium K23_9]|uniref:Uncharacterized protein n=1 Tax=Stieleria marina TaxID=1930275 RepID=A0A517P3G6_9BACT|nr:hypothetical protein K239x_59350 [Planctomycetes bacterium K23_9]
MTQLFTKTITTLGLLVLTAFASNASADTYHHIDELALQIERNSKRLISEVRHYRHTPEYSHLVSDARHMARLADHVHDLAHDHGSLTHLNSDLVELDRKFHHLESVFNRVEHNAAYGHGHIHGDTSHVRGLLCSIESDLHHLQDDIRSLVASHRHARQPVVVRRPVITQPSWYGHSPSRWSGYNARPQSSGFGHSYSRGRQFSIGGGSSRVTFRF